MCTYIHIHTNIYIHICITYLPNHDSIYVCIYIHMYMFIYICVHIYICQFIYICVVQSFIHLNLFDSSILHM